MSTAPNALSQLKAKFKVLLKRSKKDDKPTETTKPADTAAKPAEETASEAATDSVAAAARKYSAILPACIPPCINVHMCFYSLRKTRPERLGDCGSRLTLNCVLS